MNDSHRHHQVTVTIIIRIIILLQGLVLDRTWVLIAIDAMDAAVRVTAASGFKRFGLEGFGVSGV